jgi:hypothetical protein
MILGSESIISNRLNICQCSWHILLIWRWSERKLRETSQLARRLQAARLVFQLSSVERIFPMWVWVRGDAGDKSCYLTMQAAGKMQPRPVHAPTYADKKLCVNTWLIAILLENRRLISNLDQSPVWPSDLVGDSCSFFSFSVKKSEHIWNLIKFKICSQFKFCSHKFCSDSKFVQIEFC